TLLKILAGVLPFDKGARTVGHGVTLHYFAQHQAEALNPEHTVLDSLAEVSKQAEMNFLRGIAGAFLFSGPDQKKPVKALSGGERNRVALARMLVEPANTLLLDEPTNHLDPASVDVLTDALMDFPGTLVFLSHDPTFLARIATKLVEIENGQAKDYLGDYEYYLWKRAQELESIKGAPEPAKPVAPKKPAQPQPQPTAAARSAASADKEKAALARRRELGKTQTRLEKQITRAETEIADQERRIKERDAQLADPTLYQNYTRWHELHEEQTRWKAVLEHLTAKWETLSKELEEVKQQLAG